MFAPPLEVFWAKAWRNHRLDSENAKQQLSMASCISMILQISVHRSNIRRTSRNLLLMTIYCVQAFVMYVIVCVYIYTYTCVCTQYGCTQYIFICRFIHVWYCTMEQCHQNSATCEWYSMCPPLAPRLETTNLRCSQLEKAKAMAPNWCSSPLALNVWHSHCRELSVAATPHELCSMHILQGEAPLDSPLDG